MMFNSLDRLLDGIATTLRDDVAPRVDDDYVRAQAHAAAELLAHLAEHVEWRCDQLRAEIDAARAVLRIDDDPATQITDNHELIVSHDALLAAVAGIQRSTSVPTVRGDDDASTLSTTLDDFVRSYHAHELELFAAARSRARRSAVSS
ncbi:MAG TPA: hypothetical protein VM282_26865 [Acidimicrobiales bacterium]|nr:hypothetical protein [Acidimicrobiales bacterium]